MCVVIKTGIILKERKVKHIIIKMSCSYRYFTLLNMECSLGRLTPIGGRRPIDDFIDSFLLLHDQTLLPQRFNSPPIRMDFMEPVSRPALNPRRPALPLTDLSVHLLQILTGQTDAWKWKEALRLMMCSVCCSGSCAGHTPSLQRETAHPVPQVWGAMQGGGAAGAEQALPSEVLHL